MSAGHILLLLIVSAGLLLQQLILLVFLLITAISVRAAFPWLVQQRSMMLPGLRPIGQLMLIGAEGRYPSTMAS